MIEHWSRVEDALCDVFVSSLGIELADIDEAGVAAAAFYAVINFETKLAMTHAAVSHRYPPFPSHVDARSAAWKALHNRLTQKSKARNKLAHFQAYHEPSNKPGHRFVLRPRDEDPKTKAFCTEKSLPKFRVNELRATIRSFSELTVDVTNFAMHISV